MRDYNEIPEGRKLYSLSLPLEMFKEKQQCYSVLGTWWIPALSPSHYKQKGYFPCISVSILSGPPLVGRQPATRFLPQRVFLVVCS